MNNPVLLQSKKYLFIAIFLLFPLFVFSQKTISVVIDPGHGGRDPGNLAVQKNMLDEKHINLKIAKKVGNYIETSLKNVEVIYTRTTDTYPSLERRTEIANSKDADYFISIHSNWNAISSIAGTRVHIHSKRNKVSYGLAKEIDRQFKNRARRTSRGIMDAHDRGNNYYVLEHTKMPALLIECGFMSNPAEERYLNTDYGQSIIASAIYRAFRDYTKPERKKSPSRKQKKHKPDYQIVYKVQIRASTEPIPSTRFNSLGMTVEEHVYTHETFKYKYMVGNETSFGAANALRKKLMAKGYTDAFVVSMKQ